MESIFAPHHNDLVTPDGYIEKLQGRTAFIRIENISPFFVGFEMDQAFVYFNLKSTLAQVGLNAFTENIELDLKNKIAQVEVKLDPIGDLAIEMLKYLRKGAYIGKLFAADERRLVRNPDYLFRTFGRVDRKGRPLLLLGEDEARSLKLKKTERATVAYLSLLPGVIRYKPSVYGFLPTLGEALLRNISATRQLLQLHQEWVENAPREVASGEVLLVRTLPLHVRTVYARVASHELPEGYRHTTADVLQPDTTDSGDVYELYGSSKKEVQAIPLEFYTLEPYREHVFFADRDQLQSALEDPHSVFAAFETAPEPEQDLAATFIVKGTQMKELAERDWIVRSLTKSIFPGLTQPERQTFLAERYVSHQPAYDFLKAIEDGQITSQGVLFCRHFPTPLLKSALLSQNVLRCLKRLYFQYPSASYGDFFSHEDRAMLVDLSKFGIPVYWADKSSGKILQYVLRQEKEAGLFVPLALVDVFRRSTVFGVYGSNLIEGIFEQELKALLQGVLEMRAEMQHHLLHKDTPLALLTGGGPGAMEVGNRVARSLHILSCANIVDFRARTSGEGVVNEQMQNAYIDAKMTYRLDRLVERQAEFYLDIPIFLPGGIGMDFEYALEEVRRKTGAVPANPVLLFGEREYWQRKITSRFQLNLETGTIADSEWVSNCFYCIQTAEQGLAVLRRFFSGTLPIGKDGPVYEDGFAPLG